MIPDLGYCSLLPASGTILGNVYDIQNELVM